MYSYNFNDYNYIHIYKFYSGPLNFLEGKNYLCLGKYLEMLLWMKKKKKKKMRPLQKHV